MKTCAALAVLAACLGTGSGRAQDAPTTNSSAKLVPAKLDSKQPNLDNLYPQPLYREALVYVGVEISAQGTVSDATLLEGGFHDKRFEEAALKIARKIRFIPAQLDGVSVASKGLVPIRFQIPEPDGKPIQGVTFEFNRELKKVRTLIENKDLSGAHFHAQWMLSEKVKLGYEYAVLQSTLAFTYYRVGNVHRALKAARDVTAHTSMNLEQYRPGGPPPRISMRDFLLTKELLDQMLKLRFVLASSQGFYLDAVRAQADREALGLAASDDAFASDNVKLLDALQNRPQLRAHARIDDDKEWNHDLWFNRFAIHSLSGGSLGELKLTCDGYARTLRYVAGAEYTIPPRWSDCRLALAGTPGTEFDIMEYRDAPTETPPATKDSGGEGATSPPQTLPPAAAR